MHILCCPPLAGARIIYEGTAWTKKTILVFFFFFLEAINTPKLKYQDLEAFPHETRLFPNTIQWRLYLKCCWIINCNTISKRFCRHVLDTRPVYQTIQPFKPSPIRPNWTLKCYIWGMLTTCRYKKTCCADAQKHDFSIAFCKRPSFYQTRQHKASHLDMLPTNISTMTVFKLHYRKW